MRTSSNPILMIDNNTFHILKWVRSQRGTCTRSGYLIVAPVRGATINLVSNMYLEYQNTLDDIFKISKLCNLISKISAFKYSSYFIRSFY